jgi:hypothetical protein
VAIQVGLVTLVLVAIQVIAVLVATLVIQEYRAGQGIVAFLDIVDGLEIAVFQVIQAILA